MEHYRLFEVCENAQQDNVFFIFDIYRFPALQELWEAMRYRQDIKWRYLYQGSYFDGYLARSPLLLQLKNGNPAETLFLSLNEIADDIDDAGLIIVSRNDVMQEHQHWLYWVNALQPDEQPIHIPFYHASVFSRLWEVLSETERASFVGNHRTLYRPLRDENGQCVLTLIDTQCLQPMQIPSEKKPACHHYDQDTLDRLFYPERIESLIQSLYKKYFYGGEIPLESVRAHFHEGLALAKQRYTDSSLLDQETFAMYRFLLGNRFYEHPQFQQNYGADSLRERIARFVEKANFQQVSLTSYADPDWLKTE